jgi:hypothetical protein
VNHRRVLGFFGFIAVLALLWPAVSPADHVSLTATVSASLKERVSSRSWSVEVSWNATCQGAAPGAENYTGSLHLVDLDTGEASTSAASPARRARRRDRSRPAAGSGASGRS